MIDMVDAAIGAAGLGIVGSAAALRSIFKARRDERAQVIAMGAGLGIEHVPGEDFARFRQEVVIARDRRAKLADMRWQEAEQVRLHANGITRVRDEKGRFV
jgi:hypothetical protein